MALWGKSELIYNSGKVTINFSDKNIHRHSGTVDFVAAGIKTGDVITVGAAGSIGAAIVSAVVGVHTVSIASTNDLRYLGNNQITDQNYYINEKPKSTLGDSTYDAPELRTTGFSTSLLTRSVLGVDVAETGVAKDTKYAVEHAGWVGITSYTDMHGNLRVKSETLVAFSGITSDREDTLYPDS